MNLFQRILDHVLWFLAAGAGFFVGLFALLIAKLVGLGSWWVAFGVVVVASLLFVLDGKVFKFTMRGIVGGLKALGAETREIGPEDEARKRWQDRASRIGFVAGVVLAFIAGSIVSPERIMDFF
ncbi:MAG: hypothetical protein RIE24_16100 [Silicimonas sp.]